MSPRAIAAMVLLVVVGSAGSTSAAIYRWVDTDGVINYSDNPWRFEAQRRQMSPEQDPPIHDSNPQRAVPGEASGLPKPTEPIAPSRIDSLAVDVMRLSGMDVTVALMAAMIQGEFQRWIALGVRPAAGGANLVAHRFNVDTLRDNAQHALARHLGQPQTATLVGWLRGPLSQRIVALESASATSEPEAELTSFVNQLPSAPPAPPRLVLIRRLERAADVTEGSASVAAAAVAALRRTLTPLLPPGLLARRGLDAPPAGFGIDDDYRFRIMASLLFTYRELSDEELGRYVAFLESPTGRWFTQISRRAYLASLGTAQPPTRP